MLFSGDIVNDTYSIVEEIGSGGMGVVYLAYHLRLEKYVVMKKIKNRNLDSSLLRNEVDILKKLHHPYLPQVYDIIEYECDFYTVIDYIDGKDLEHFINGGYVFTESQLIKWLRQLCEVLDYLHCNNPPIIHTDIKPANIIVRDNGDICLIDFGISLSADDAVKGYSKNYSSPEQYMNVMNILNGTPEFNVQLDGRTDIYSLGATYYHLMTGCIPDIEDETLPLLEGYELPYSQPFVSIISKAMEWDIKKRYKSAAKMLSAVDNIKKQDERYKRYILLQVLSSVVSGIMIVSGVLMFVFGNYEIAGTELATQYDLFVSYCDKGDTVSAKQLGTDLLNNSKYRNVMTDKTMAEILHYMGDCYFDEEDYANAVENYKSAYENADDDDAEVYLRDYAIALVRGKRFSEAQSVISTAEEKFPNSSVNKLIQAEIEYENGNVDTAMNYANECLNAEQNGDNAFAAWLLKGDICMDKNQYTDAVSNYESARSIDENLSVLRKLGQAYLGMGSLSSGVENSSLQKAKECYSTIRDRYYLSAEDGINYSQAYSLSGDLSGAKNLLDELAKTYPDDCRVYMQLAVISNMQNDSQCGMYCEKARALYKESSDSVKQTIDSNRLNEIKNLYRRYLGSVW